MKSRALPRRSIPESLVDDLRERILSGEIGEGEALVQDSIAEDYAVSRMPVREALRQLEACGLVSMRTHKGAVVRTVPTERIAEMFELRSLLEGELLRRAIPNLTDADLKEASDALRALEDAYRGGDLAAFGRLNWAFHRALYAPAGRGATLEILDSINLQLERYVRLHLVLTDGIKAAEKEHRELLKLCATGETGKAVDYLRAHIEATAIALLREVRMKRADLSAD